MKHRHSLYILIFFLTSIQRLPAIIPAVDASPTSVAPLTKSPQKGIDIQKVMNYKMPQVIHRYRKDHNVSEEDAKCHEIELKRFLIIAADDDEPLSMLSKEVDNLWHTFLLFTKEYQSFCNEMFGHFIHHVPEIDVITNH